MKKTIILLALVTACCLSAEATEMRNQLLSQRLSTGMTPAAYNAEGKLDVPQFTQFTEVSNGGFTANWADVDGADGYSFYTYLFHTAQASEDYAILDTKFQLYDAGYNLAITSPLTYETLGYYGYLDGIVERSDWMCYMPALANGYLGLDNAKMKNGTYGEIESPFIDLTPCGGKVKVHIRCMGDGVTRASVRLSGTEVVNGFTMEKVLDKKYFDVTNEFEDYEFEVENGDANCSVMIRAEEGSGRLWLDELKVSIPLEKGRVVQLPYVYRQGEDMTGTSTKVVTDDRTAGDAYACKIACFEYDSTGTAVWETSSDFSELSYVPAPNDQGSVSNLTAAGAVKVENTADGVRIVLKEPATVTVYNLSGRAVYSSPAMAETHDVQLARGIYIARAGSATVKIAK